MTAPLPAITVEPRPTDPKVILAQENESLACFAWQAMLADPPVAVALFQELCAREPNASDYWTALGNALVKTNARKEAMSAFETAVGLKPKNIEAWCLLGELAVEAQEWAKAAAALSRCVALDPHSKHPHGARARALMNQEHKRLSAVSPRSP